ncbi:hypothetical protein CC1G_02916 [Coprinopsis cinerea okayama7|uniref:RING-type domain-containing protein n=1 Tax=Coprinopsis cinerea (strain Okayama-7 / 130 / ATCC MYA-4618 / FGSC 9003) TaxID=240176 RepID=A8NRQ3_COPC7|nr:hypothetical protein CC1G_02916 [Coprinopsis cinerea okayama7\|eukprot:XP_001835828.1 hypothetical protein CC1G_02916 [Coprinopsis cinerea okayama7\
MSEDQVNAMTTQQQQQLPVPESSHCAMSLSATLKRPASPSFENGDQPVRKRLKEEADKASIVEQDAEKSQDARMVDELALELQCGCCSELVYNPVLVLPCQHFFCGSCCVLWVRNGGTNCPACRGVSSLVTPFRAIQPLLDTLLRLAPEKTRAAGERAQADEVYRHGSSLRIPSPKEPSPEPTINVNADLAQPCPNCPPGNPHGWRCPHPIPDPAADPDNAWHLDDGIPPGHGQCGHCENLLALEAPLTTKCDLCKVVFCGINIPGRCSAVPLALQHPQGLANVGDLIESAEVYESFDGNTYEVDILFDYLRTQNKLPRQIYREIITHTLAQPRGLQPFLESDAFLDVHGGVLDAIPQGPFNRICRVCAAEALLWGLKDWWIRERQKGHLDTAILGRPDCPDGNACQRQKETAHAKEFNHIISPPQSSPPPNASLPISAPPEGAVPLLASSSVDDVEHLILPQPSSGSMTSQQRASALSYLLNSTNLDEPEALHRAIARRLQSSSPDLRDAIDALAS